MPNTNYSFGKSIRDESHALATLKNSTSLSNEDYSFIIDVKAYADNGGFLSPKQLQKLSALWATHINRKH